MLRSTIGLTDQLVENKITLVELTPIELTWVMRYAYAQYFYWQGDDRATATLYYNLSHAAAMELVSRLISAQTGGAE